MATADKEAKTNYIDLASALLAAITALAGVIRAMTVDPIGDALNDDTLKFFAVAGALLMIRKVKVISFGGTTIELGELEKKVDEATEEARTASSMAQFLTREQPTQAGTWDASAARTAGVPSGAVGVKGEDIWDRTPGNEPDDPWKGAFGGLAEVNHRRLRASVVATAGDSDWYRIRLWVDATDPVTRPLSGRVRFFIHDSFNNWKPFVDVRKGRAELRLHAYGAFTVGVLADGGETELELDLSEDRSFPKGFRDN